MAAFDVGDFTEDGTIISEELAVLESIYITELSVEKDDDGRPHTISLLLHPNTGMDESKKYVCMTLQFKIPWEYPQKIPEILVRNPRGLAEEEVCGLIEDMKKVAESRREGPMLFELIEMAKDCLTEGNVPHGKCPICLEKFDESDHFIKTDCYHYFHHACLVRYAQAFTSTLVAGDDSNTTPLHTQDSEAENPALCPLCRVALSCDMTALKAQPIPAEGEFTFVLTPELQQQQRQRAELYARQKDKGGIIDLEQEKNKFLIDKNTVISLDEALKCGEPKRSATDPVPAALSEGVDAVRGEHSQPKGRGGHPGGASGQDRPPGRGRGGGGRQTHHADRGLARRERRGGRGDRLGEGPREKHWGKGHSKGGDDFGSRGKVDEDFKSHGNGGDDFRSRGKGDDDFRSHGKGGDDFRSHGKGGDDFRGHGKGGEDYRSRGKGSEDCRSHGKGGEDFRSRGKGGDDFRSHGKGGDDFRIRGKGDDDFRSHVKGGEDFRSHGKGGDDFRSHSKGGDDFRSRGKGDDGFRSHGKGGDDFRSHGKGGDDFRSHSKGGDDFTSHGKESEDFRSHGKGSEDFRCHGKGGDDFRSHGKCGDDFRSRGKGGDDFRSHGKGGEDFRSHGKGGDDFRSHGKGGDDFRSRGKGGDDFRSRGKGGEDFRSHGKGGDDFRSHGKGNGYDVNVRNGDCGGEGYSNRHGQHPTSAQASGPDRLREGRRGGWVPSGQAGKRHGLDRHSARRREEEKPKCDGDDADGMQRPRAIPEDREDGEDGARAERGRRRRGRGSAAAHSQGQGQVSGRRHHVTDGDTQPRQDGGPGISGPEETACGTYSAARCSVDGGELNGTSAVLGGRSDFRGKRGGHPRSARGRFPRQPKGGRTSAGDGSSPHADSAQGRGNQAETVSTPREEGCHGNLNNTARENSFGGREEHRCKAGSARKGAVRDAQGSCSASASKQWELGAEKKTIRPPPGFEATDFLI